MGRLPSLGRLGPLLRLAALDVLGGRGRGVMIIVSARTATARGLGGLAKMGRRAAFRRLDLSSMTSLSFYACRDCGW